MNRRLATWMLMAGCALLASFIARAAFLALERSHGAIVSLAYDVQNPIADAAIVAFAIAGTAVIRQLGEGLRAGASAELLLPAFAGVLRMGLGRCTAALLTLQFASGFFGQLGAQAISLHGRVSHIAWPSDPQAIAVHAVIGGLLALFLWTFARAACHHVRAVANLARALVEWIARPSLPRVAHELTVRILESSVPPPPVLARGLANRPPPALLAPPA